MPPFSFDTNSTRTNLTFRCNRRVIVNSTEVQMRIKPPKFLMKNLRFALVRNTIIQPPIATCIKHRQPSKAYLEGFFAYTNS